MGCAPRGIIACTARLAAGADRWGFEDTLQQAEALPARLGRRPLQRQKPHGGVKPPLLFGGAAEHVAKAAEEAKQAEDEHEVRLGV
jgi:hypothetical protein